MFGEFPPTYASSSSSDTHTPKRPSTKALSLKLQQTPFSFTIEKSKSGPTRDERVIRGLRRK